jgi:hypothetical protein
VIISTKSKVPKKGNKYLLEQSPKRNMEATSKMLPAKIKALGPYASKIGPIGAPQKNLGND